ncbi:uncharacterized protein LOC133707359 [Rosa rugosa]|uniref:uncharacterized protein LOC133707359 n=1 Tax=Rosa rugosa TaxID=74645 RepID=UPI002B404BCE|nr:uncharacterized protein LOC133707359 [Rosa rugosa]
MASTPVGSNALILEVLDRSNYEDWRSRLKTYLLAEDLWEAVEAIVKPPKREDDRTDYKAWTKKNAKALYAIQNTCGRELFSFIREIETAKSAWEALEQECKVMQGYDENNVDHLGRYKLFIESVSSGDWDKAKKCLGEVDMRSVVVRAVDGDGEIALHVAAEEGHAHIVKELVHLMTQEDLKTKTAHGHTALHLAAAEGHVHVVKELPVQLMGEVKDKDGDTALHTAVQEGKVDIIKELVLLMRLEDLKIKNDAGYTALHLAVNKGNVPMVKEFVRKEKGENNIGKDDFKRYIPFTTCVINGDWNKANERLKKLDNPYGAVTTVDPRHKSHNYGDTALHVAAREGHLDVIKGLVLLLKIRQEDLELKTAEDFTTFGSGITIGVSEEFLMEKAKYMVEQCEKTLGSVLEIQNAKGSTALHVAVLQGYGDIVKELVPLMRKEGLEIKDADGDTALIIAILQGRLDIVKELVPVMRKEGLEIKDNDGDTALNIAVLQGRLDIVKELVQLMRQEGLEIKNKNGSNALHLAVNNEHMHVAKELMALMRPEALEEKDGAGYTALSMAIRRFKDGDVCEMAKYMAEKNVKVLGIPSAPHDEIPVVRACRSSKWKSARYMCSVTPLEALEGPNGSDVICYSLDASRTIDLAWNLLQRCPNLAFTITKSHFESPMLKLARMRFAFLSGTRLTRWQRWLYDCIYIREVDHVNVHDISISVAESKEYHSNKRDFISSVISLYRRFAKSLYIFCGIHCIYEMKSTHKWIFQILHCMGEATRVDSLTPDQLDMVQKSIFKAIEQGHYEFVTQLYKANPELILGTEDEMEKNIFDFAIENRQKEVYSLIYGLEEEKRNDIGIAAGNFGSLLHSAANLSSLPQFNHIQDASLQMQRELQWFKEVESVIPLEMHEYRNLSDNLTAHELFTKNHKKLIEDAENSTKGTAASCTVVGALIVTMMFTAAFTVPGGNNDNTGLPVLLDRRLFKVFIVSDTISLVSSTTSVITFLGILTSRYAEDDFLKSLPTKMMIGLFTLFFSIATMMIAFSCALVIMLDREAWIVIPSILFASVPLISFVWLLFPLLGKIFMSTYGPGIFDKRNRVKS